MVGAMATNPSSFIGSTEACRLLDVDKSTLTRWVADGTITPAHKNPGRNGAFLFARSDIEALNEQRRADHREQASA